MRKVNQNRSAEFLKFLLQHTRISANLQQANHTKHFNHKSSLYIFDAYNNREYITEYIAV